MKTKKLYEETKGLLIRQRGHIGVVAGHDNSSLIAAYPVGTTFYAWNESAISSKDCIDEKFLNKGYEFSYTDKENVVGYKESLKRIRMKTLEELAQDPLVTLHFSGTAVNYISCKNTPAIINDSMLQYLGKEFTLTEKNISTVDGYIMPGKWTAYPWMYHDITPEC
jgi:hypothetical protein